MLHIMKSLCKLFLLLIILIFIYFFLILIQSPAIVDTLCNPCYNYIVIINLASKKGDYFMPNTTPSTLQSSVANLNELINQTVSAQQKSVISTLRFLQYESKKINLMQIILQRFSASLVERTPSGRLCTEKKFTIAVKDYIDLSNDTPYSKELYQLCKDCGFFPSDRKVTAKRTEISKEFQSILVKLITDGLELINSQSELQFFLKSTEELHVFAMNQERRSLETGDFTFVIDIR